MSEPDPYVPRQFTTENSGRFESTAGVLGRYLRGTAFPSLAAANTAPAGARPNGFGFNQEQVQELKIFMLYNAVHDDRITADRDRQRFARGQLVDEEHESPRADAKQYWGFMNDSAVSLNYEGAPSKFAPATVDRADEDPYELASPVVPSTKVPYNPRRRFTIAGIKAEEAALASGDGEHLGVVNPKATPLFFDYPNAPEFVSPNQTSTHYADRTAALLILGRSRKSKTTAELLPGEVAPAPEVPL